MWIYCSTRDTNVQLEYPWLDPNLFHKVSEADKRHTIVLVFIESLGLHTPTVVFFFGFFYQRCMISKITFRDFKNTYSVHLFSFSLKRPSRVLRFCSPEHINIVISGLLQRSRLQERYTNHAPRHMKAFHTIKYIDKNSQWNWSFT